MSLLSKNPTLSIKDEIAKSKRTMTLDSHSVSRSPRSLSFVKFETEKVNASQPGVKGPPASHT